MYKIISAKRLSNGAGGSQIHTKARTIRKDCTIRQFDGTAEEMADHLDAIKFRAEGKPYVFTHIEGRDVFGNRCIIQQDINGLTTSPTKLAELLGV